MATGFHRSRKELKYCRNEKCGRLLRIDKRGKVAAVDGYCPTDNSRIRRGQPMIGWGTPDNPEPTRRMRGPSKYTPEQAGYKPKPKSNLKKSARGYLPSVGVRDTMSMSVHIVFPEGF